MPTAVIADIVSSRHIPQGLREHTQIYLARILVKLDRHLAFSQERKLEITGGDGIQGLFNDEFAAYAAARLLQITLYPVLIRVGMGTGEWTIRVEGKPSSYQDGPAYHNAKHALESLDPRGNPVASGPDTEGVSFSEVKSSPWLGPALGTQEDDDPKRGDTNCAVAQQRNLCSYLLAGRIFEQTEVQRTTSASYEIAGLSRLLSLEPGALQDITNEMLAWRRTCSEEFLSEVSAYSRSLDAGLRRATMSDSVKVRDASRREREVSRQALAKRIERAHIYEILQLDRAWKDLGDLSQKR